MSVIISYISKGDTFPRKRLCKPIIYPALSVNTLCNRIMQDLPSHELRNDGGVMMVGEGQSCEIFGHPKEPQAFHSMKKYCLTVAISMHRMLNM